MGKSVTLRDVAEAAGVSRQVVTAVLADSQRNVRFSAATKDKVEAAIQELGYRRNRQAAQMRRGQHGALAILSSNLNFIPGNTLEWIVELASAAGLLVIIERMQPGANWAPRLLHENYADGVLVFESLTAEQYHDLERLRIPAIHVHAESPTAHNHIIYDIPQAIKDTGAYFHKHHRSRWCFIGDNSGRHFSTQERYTALCNEAETHGITNPPFIPFTEFHSIDLNDYDAIFCDTYEAVDPLNQLALIQKRTVPNDVMIICSANEPTAQSYGRTIPRLRLVAKNLAEICLEMLSKAMHGNTPPTTRTFPYILEFTQEPNE